ncbi:MAG: MFS transporter [Clostridia bacterium]|nr:MFS transporter [Clostridia bacterium]
MTERRMNWVFGFLQGMYWTSYCVLFPFLVQMCTAYGYDDFQSGVVLTGATIANLVMQPVIGSICDKMLRIKPLFVSLFLAGGAISLLLFVGKYNFFVLFITMLLLSACVQTLQYIIDIWSVRISMTGVNYNYGFSRSFGSVFYAITAVVFGAAIERFSIDITSPVFIVCALITAGIAMLVREDEAALLLRKKREAGEGGKKETVPFLKACTMLLKNKEYMIFLISYFVMQLGNLPVYNYTSRKFEILGAGSSLYGVALFVMAITEVPLLIYLKKLKVFFGNRTLVLMSFVGMVIRICAIAFAPTPTLLALAFLTQSISYGIFIGAMIHYMSEIVPDSILFTAQTVFAAVSIGLSGILGNLIGGYYAKVAGVLEMMHTFVIFVFIGALIFAIPMIMVKRKKSNGGKTI